jgi:hypothetical protein
LAVFRNFNVALLGELNLVLAMALDMALSGVEGIFYRILLTVHIQSRFLLNTL